MRQKLIFMGSDSIALPALNAILDGSCGSIGLSAVYTQPDKPRGRGKRIEANAIKLWARENGVPVFQPYRVDQSVRYEIEAINADTILVMAYGHLLPQVLIDTPPLGIWNLHTSILPRYRGAAPIQSAIASGDLETGVSFMKVVKEMDAGPVLDVEKVNIEHLDTALTLETKLSRACLPLLERCLPIVFSGGAMPNPQDENRVSYVRKLTKADGGLDFRRPAEEVAKRVNALFPWPGTRFRYGDSVIKVGLADHGALELEASAGQVISLEAEGLAVACGTGALYLKQLQRPGGKMLGAASFVRGFELPVGTVLESVEMASLVSKQYF